MDERIEQQWNMETWPLSSFSLLGAILCCVFLSFYPWVFTGYAFVFNLLGIGTIVRQLGSYTVCIEPAAFSLSTCTSDLMTTGMIKTETIRSCWLLSPQSDVTHMRGLMRPVAGEIRAWLGNHMIYRPCVLGWRPHRSVRGKSFSHGEKKPNNVKCIPHHSGGPRIKQPHKFNMICGLFVNKMKKLVEDHVTLSLPSRAFSPSIIPAWRTSHFLLGPLVQQLWCYLGCLRL